MRFTFFVREAMRALGRNAMPSFAAMVTILVTILVIGVFIPVVQATTGAANEVRGKLLLDVYMKPAADAADIKRVRELLVSDTPNVKAVEYVSKEKAYAAERKNNPEAYELLGKVNPLPDTFRVTPTDPDRIDAIRDKLAPTGTGTARTPADGAIDEVKNRRDETEKILAATSVVKLSVGALALLLGVASMMLIANTIRLSLFARRREVEVMKLVGATDWFIRWPFVIEGVIVGFAGAVLAIAFLAVGKVAFIDPLAEDFALIAAPDTVSFPLLVAVLLGAAVLVSAAGSGLSLRRFLRV